MINAHLMKRLLNEMYKDGITFSSELEN